MEFKVRSHARANRRWYVIWWAVEWAIYCQPKMASDIDRKHMSYTESLMGKSLRSLSSTGTGASIRIVFFE